MIQLGDTVKDVITGFTGIAISKCEYLNGCVQFNVKPAIDSKTKEMKKSAWIDEQQLIVTKFENISNKLESGGGIRNHP